MIVKKKNVYYCEYCSKKSLRSVIIHEKHCTANPDRECRLCDNQKIKPIIEKYQKYFYLRETKNSHPVSEWGEIKVTPVFKKKFTLEDLMNELDYECPNCILALIRCLGLNRYWMDKKYEFDYKEALGEWWAVANEEQREKDFRETHYGY